MDKASLRRKYKDLRKSFTQEQIDEYSISIANQLLGLNIWDKSFYHVFLSITEQNEINTEYILNILAGRDKNIVISKSHFDDCTMTHYLLTDNTLIKKNRYNIPEPINGISLLPHQVEVVFIPLLAFNRNGHRIGYGKGFYDRFLANCKPETLKIGLSFFNAEDIEFDTTDMDIKLDYCVTPYRVYRF
jgi:5-formyltetrahydrofolate cyclo-ligase